MEKNDNAGHAILLVDDDPLILIGVGAILENKGYQVVTCDCGEKALDRLKRKQFDLVITDLVMGEVDGIRILKTAKTSNPETMVIILTGMGDITSAINALRHDADDFLLKPCEYEELFFRVERCLDKLEARKRLRAAETALRKSEQRYRRLSITDSLTGLFNSRHFFSQLKKEIERAQRYRPPLSLLVLDIDDFKKYNDRFGHIEGDKVLARAGKLIQDSLRKTDSAYRYGGEEFTVIMPETDGQEAQHIAERIRKTFADQVFKPNEQDALRITASIGIAEYRNGENMSEFIKRADSNMYVAKKKGKNRIFYSE